jgi:hypothetical protein
VKRYGWIAAPASASVASRGWAMPKNLFYVVWAGGTLILCSGILVPLIVDARRRYTRAVAVAGQHLYLRYYFPPQEVPTFPPGAESGWIRDDEGTKIYWCKELR